MTDSDMKKNNNIDQWLKNCFQDDMPEDVESDLIHRFSSFQRQWDSQQVNRGRDLSMEGWHNTLWGKTVIVCCSVLVMLGTFLIFENMSSGVLSNSLASQITAVQTMASTFTEIRKTESMQCELVVLNDKKKVESYTIVWKQPDKTRVDYREGTDEVVETWWIRDHQMTIKNHTPMRSSTVKDMLQNADPVRKIVLSLLTPDDVEDNLKGVWKEKSIPQADLSRFSIQKNAFSSPYVEIWVQSDTNLPSTLQFNLVKNNENDERNVITVELHFNWNVDLPDDRFLPESNKLQP